MEKILTEVFWWKMLNYLVIIFYVLLNIYIINYLVHERMKNDKLFLWILWLLYIFGTPFLLIIIPDSVTGQIGSTVIIVSQMIINLAYFIFMGKRIKRKILKDYFIKKTFENKYIIISKIKERIEQEEDIIYGEEPSASHIKRFEKLIDLTYLLKVLSSKGDYYTAGIKDDDLSSMI